MNKYRVIEAVITADPDNPSMGTLRKVETPCHSSDTALMLYRDAIFEAMNADPFPTAFRVRMQEYCSDERWHDIHNADY